MGEVIPFPKQPKLPKQQVESETAEAVIWERLSQETRGDILSLMRTLKGINQGNMTNRKKLNEQRMMVQNWGDQQVIDFLENKANWSEFQQKPHFFLALAERAIGKA